MSACALGEDDQPISPEITTAGGETQAEETKYSRSLFVPFRGWKFRIQDILDAVQAIQEYTQGVAFKTFSEGLKTVDAVVSAERGLTPHTKSSTTR